MTARRDLLRLGAVAALGATLPKARAQGKLLRCGVGPLLPTASDTVAAYTPFFAYVAKQLGTEFELKATTDWAGMAVAMGSGQLDLAWMGPWGYVIANNATGCEAIATAKYDGQPVYHAIVVARPDLPAGAFPDSTKGRSISFADVGSTSGWLIPSYVSRTVWKIDPKTFWDYHEGATHAANEIAVASGQVDMATDFDRNRNTMIETGKIKPDATRIVWTSDPLPNDAIVLPKGASPELAAKLRAILTAITPEQAATILPRHYDGFVAATHASYASIEAAGATLGKLKPRV